MTENTHALLSPSGAKKWMACPGSLAMEKDIPNTSSEFADEGTAGHELASICLADGFQTEDFLGGRIKVGERKFDVTQDFADDVQIYVDMVRERIMSYYEAGAISVTLEVEQRVPIGHITGEEGATGTSDCVLLVEFADYGLIEVIDLKMGRGVVVEAEGNEQGMMYALGALHKFSILGDFTKFRITIHQPRLSRAPSEWEIDLDTLMAFGEKASAAATHAMYLYTACELQTRELFTTGPGDLILNPGDHCRKSFCRARGNCPAYRDAAFEAMSGDFDVISDEMHKEFSDIPAIPPEEQVGMMSGVVETVMEKVHTRLANADDQLLDALFPHLDLVDDWLRQVRAHIEARLFAGAKFENVKLVQGKQGNRKWADEYEAEKMMKSMRLKRDVMYDYKVISPTSAEKVLKKTPKRWAAMQALITRSEGGMHVAPISDKRPAIEIKPPSDDFDVVSDLA